MDLSSVPRSPGIIPEMKSLTETVPGCSGCCREKASSCWVSFSPLTDAELQAIRDFNARWTDRDLDCESTPFARMVRESRALLAEIDRLRARVAELEASIDDRDNTAWEKSERD